MDFFYYVFMLNRSWRISYLFVCCLNDLIELLNKSEWTWLYTAYDSFSTLYLYIALQWMTTRRDITRLSSWLIYLTRTHALRSNARVGVNWIKLVWLPHPAPIHLQLYKCWTALFCGGGGGCIAVVCRMWWHNHRGRVRRWRFVLGVNCFLRLTIQKTKIILTI